MMARLWNGAMHRVHLVASGRTDTLLYELTWRLGGYDLRRESLEELGLSAERSMFYANSGGPDLKRLLQTMEIPPGSRALDLGCGKGGAMLSMQGFGFEEIVGIDLSAPTLEAGRANAARARARGMLFVHADAATFTDLDRFTHLYFFHPFPMPVFQAVMDNLRASLERTDRDLTMIYKNPVAHEAVMDAQIFQTFRDHKPDAKAPDWDIFRIYTHKAALAAVAPGA